MVLSLSEVAKKSCFYPHETLLGTQRVSNPATKKDLAARTWSACWDSSKMPVLFEIMVQITHKRGRGVENPAARSLWGGVVLRL